LNELPRCKQRGINRNIYNRPKGCGIYPLSASGELARLGRINLTLKPADGLLHKFSHFGYGRQFHVGMTFSEAGINRKFKTFNRIGKFLEPKQFKWQDNSRYYFLSEKSKKISSEI
jgi:hypothetical protein